VARWDAACSSAGTASSWLNRRGEKLCWFLFCLIGSSVVSAGTVTARNLGRRHGASFLGKAVLAPFAVMLRWCRRPESQVLDYSK